MALAASLYAASPFSVGFPDLSDEWFPAGAVIRIPNVTPIKEIWIRLEKGAAHGIASGDVEFHLDNRRMVFKTTAQGDDFILKAYSREPLGFMRNPEHRGKAFVVGKDDWTVDWTIYPESRASIEAQVAGRSGETLGIDLDQPKGFVQRLPGQTGTNVKIRLTGGSARSIQVCGVPLHASGGAGLTFESKIELPTGRDFVVWAGDPSGSYTKIVMPIMPLPQ